MKNLYLLVALLILLFSACKRDSLDTYEECKWDRNKLRAYIQYASDGVTEVYKDEFVYDENGNQIATKNYVDGVLSGSSYNFSYDYSANKRSFLMDIYPEHNSTVTTAVEEVFTDNSFMPEKLLKRINTIGKEVSREEYSYDDKGREIGYKVYYFDNLNTEYSGYSYDNKRLTYTLNVYSEGELAGKKRVETVFYDDKCNRSKILSRIQYQGESNTEYIREEYSYDTNGRENGYKFYYLGNLTTEQKDYVYNDLNRELVFNIYSYSEHIADDKTSKSKVRILYH